MDIVDIPHLLTCACVLPRGGVLAAWACPVAFGTRNGDVLLVDLSQTVAGDDPIMERATHGVRSRAATPTEPPTTRRLRTLNAAEISDGRYTPRTFATAYGNDVVVCVRLVATEERRRAEHTVTYLTVLPHLLAVGFASGAWSLWSLNTLHCVHHSHAERDALPVTHMTLQRYLPDDNDDETKLTAFYLWVVRGSFAAPFLCVAPSVGVVFSLSLVVYVATPFSGVLSHFLLADNDKAARMSPFVTSNKRYRLRRNSTLSK